MHRKKPVKTSEWSKSFNNKMEKLLQKQKDFSPTFEDSDNSSSHETRTKYSKQKQSTKQDSQSSENETQPNIKNLSPALASLFVKLTNTERVDCEVSNVSIEREVDDLDEDDDLRTKFTTADVNSNISNSEECKIILSQNNSKWTNNSFFSQRKYSNNSSYSEERHENSKDLNYYNNTTSSTPSPAVSAPNSPRIKSQ